MSFDCAVVIPAYNAARFIEETIGSTVHSGVASLQLIVVDDGSTDETAAILARLQATHGNLTVRTQTNAGVSNARNSGLSLVTAPYVCFLDADDRLRAGCLATMWRMLENRAEAAAAFGAVAYLSEKSGVTRAARAAATLPAVALMDVLERNFTDTPGAILFRTSAVTQAGAFDPAISMGEDWDLYVRVARRGVFVFCREVAVEYRLHDVSAMRRKRLTMADFEPLLRKVFSAATLPDIPAPMRSRLELRRRAGIYQLLVQLSEGRETSLRVIPELGQLLLTSRCDRKVAVTAARTLAAALRRAAAA